MLQEDTVTSDLDKRDKKWVWWCVLGDSLKLSVLVEIFQHSSWIWLKGVSFGYTAFRGREFEESNFMWTSNGKFLQLETCWERSSLPNMTGTFLGVSESWLLGYSTRIFVEISSGFNALEFWTEEWLRLGGSGARTTAFGVKGCQQLGDQFSQSCPLATSHWTGRSVLLELLVVYYPRKLLSDIQST